MASKKQQQQMEDVGKHMLEEAYRTGYCPALGEFVLGGGHSQSACPYCFPERKYCIKHQQYTDYNGCPSCSKGNLTYLRRKD